MKNKFTILLWAQLLWLALAVGYNLIGIWRMEQGLNALVGNQPAQALAMLSLYGVLIGLGWRGRLTAYGLMLLLLLPGLIYVGVWRHVQAYWWLGDLQAYASFSAWLWALLINAYGVMVFIAALPMCLLWKKQHTGAAHTGHKIQQTESGIGE